MTENTEYSCSVHSLPTEIFIHILSYLPPEDLMKCRQVCFNWKSVIDELACKDVYWFEMCKRYYKDNYKTAKLKSITQMSWYYIYRTLCMWSKLHYASEEDDEFASASNTRKEVCNIQVLGNAIIAVHTKSAIQFYDANTFKLSSQRDPIVGDYAKYIENEHVILLQNYHLQLFIVNKSSPYTSIRNYTTTFDGVKMFYLKETKLYYVKLNDEIYYCDVLSQPHTSRLIQGNEERDGIMSLGYKYDCFHVLTYKRNIYTVRNDKEMVYRQSLTSGPNLLSVLNRYNFLEHLDWRVYFQWMYVLRHTMPEGFMRDIICIRPYGDVYLVGSNFGVLCIFYKPYTNGELDLFKSDPLAQVNFMERSDIPVLSTCPILQIDLMELENGHIVFVAMPKKVAVLKFTHDFLRPISWSIGPYDDILRNELLYS